MARYWRLIVLLALLAVAVPATAQGTNAVVVTSGAAHIRSGPSLYTTSLGTVSGGVELVVTGRNETTTWWRVETPFGVGWISAEIAAFRGLLDTVPVVNEPAGTAEAPTVIVEGVAITVYRNPNPDSFVVGIAPTGAVMEVTGRTIDGAWWQVETVMGTGFVRVDEVAFRGDERAVPRVSDPGPTFDGPTVRVNADTAVTSEPGGGLVLGTLAAGTALPAGGRTADNSWWQVAETFGIGWIPVGNVSLAGAASNIRLGSDATTPGPASTGGAFATVVIESPRKIAYAEDSFESAPMWDALLGEQLGVVGRSLDGLWLKVTKTGYAGWIHFSGITLQGTMASIPAIDTSPPPIKNFAIVNTAYLNIRSGPDVIYERLAVASGGDRFEVTGRHPSLPWLRVKGNFGTGWIQNEFVIFRGDWPAVPRVTEPTGDLDMPQAVIEFPHNVYGEPNWDTLAGSIPGGSYTIIAWSAGYAWAQIETEEFGKVWISAEQFVLRGIADNAPIVQ